MSAYCYTGQTQSLHFLYNPNVATAGCPKGCDAATSNDIAGNAFGTMVCTSSIDESGAATTASVCTGTGDVLLRLSSDGAASERGFVQGLAVRRKERDSPSAEPQK